MYQTGIAKATFWTVYGKWSANSQYGYPLGWYATEQEAIAAADAYYAKNPGLLNQ